MLTTMLGPWAGEGGAVDSAAAAEAEELNRLIETCHDGEAGFRWAAGAAQEPALAEAYLRHAEQRAKFARDLGDEVRKLGVEPATGGSTLGAVMAQFLKVWLAVAQPHPARIAAVLAAGERGAEKTYGRALEAGLSPDARLLVQLQRRAIDESRLSLETREAELDGHPSATGA